MRLYLLINYFFLKIIDILLGEIDMNNNLISYLQVLDSNIIPISLIYKCFLFAELFLLLLLLLKLLIQNTII